MANEPPTDPAATRAPTAPTAPTVPTVPTMVDVSHVARLARLALSPDELRALEGDLAKILAYVAELQAVDVTHVAPLVHPTPFVAPLRADLPGPTLDRARALAGAPEHDDQSFLVPTPKGLG